MGDFRKFGTEKKAVGQVVFGGGTVLGRIKFFDESYTEGSILCVRGGESIDRETLLLCPPLAVIVLCCGESNSISELCTLGVPCIVMSERDIKNEICKNSVALVDAERGIVTLDPSIETLNFYSSHRRSSACLSALESEIGVILDGVDKIGRRAVSAEHYLISDRVLEHENIFDSTLSLFERLKPDSITVELCVPSAYGGSERDFFERVFELYRAGLYGGIALSLVGFDCEKELCSALQILHKAFCALEAEGREFNGFMPRGITVSAPIWLLRAAPVSNPDFIILDLDRLLPSLFSLSPEEIMKKEKALKKELSLVVERYFLDFAPRCEVMIKSKLFARSSLLYDLIRLTDVRIVFS